MAENRNQEHRGASQQQGGYQPDSAKREKESATKESASKTGKVPYEQRERDRASQADQSHQDNARGDRNPGNFQNDPKRGGDR